MGGSPHPVAQTRLGSHPPRCAHRSARTARMMTTMTTSAASSIFDAGSLGVCGGGPCASGEGLDIGQSWSREVPCAMGRAAHAEDVSPRRLGAVPGLSAALHCADVADSPGEEVHRVPDYAEHPPLGARLPEACWTGTEAAGAKRLTRLGSPGFSSPRVRMGPGVSDQVGVRPMLGWSARRKRLPRPVRARAVLR